MFGIRLRPGSRRRGLRLGDVRITITADAVGPEMTASAVLRKFRDAEFLTGDR